MLAINRDRTRAVLMDDDGGTTTFSRDTRRREAVIGGALATPADLRDLADFLEGTVPEHRTATGEAVEAVEHVLALLQAPPAPGQYLALNPIYTTPDEEGELLGAVVGDGEEAQRIYVPADEAVHRGRFLYTRALDIHGHLGGGDADVRLSRHFGVNWYSVPASAIVIVP